MKITPDIGLRRKDLFTSRRVVPGRRVSLHPEPSLYRVVAVDRVNADPA